MVFQLALHQIRATTKFDYLRFENDDLLLGILMVFTISLFYMKIYFIGNYLDEESGVDKRLLELFLNEKCMN